MTLEELRNYVRDLTGVYSTDLLADSLLNRWIEESYSEVNRYDNWPWLMTEDSGVLTAGDTTITLTGGSSRVIELTLQYPNGVLYQVPTRIGLIQTVDGDDDPFYTVDVDGVVTISKELEDNVTWDAVYMIASPSVQTSGKATLIPSEFEGCLAYRTAAKVLRYQADDSTRANSFLDEYTAMVDSMAMEYIFSNDLGPIQIGGEILRVDGRTVGRVNLRFRSV